MSKEIYRILCEKNPIPLFSQHYWMDAVCGSNGWDVLLAESNGNIYASLPYFHHDNEISKAPLTQNNGLYFYYPPGIKESNKLDHQMKFAGLIIDKIESLNLRAYRQYFHYDFTNWLPFYWRGYTQTTRYTYVINDTADLELLFQNLDTNTRRNIRKAEKLVTVTRSEDAEAFYGLVSETFERQGLQTPYSYELFLDLYTVLSERDQCVLLEARDAEGNVHSCTMFVWDHDSVYNLIIGSRTEFRSSNSLSLVTWEGIKLAHKLNKKFDFEGSMKQNIEIFFRRFGPEQVPYFDISKKFTSEAQ